MSNSKHIKINLANDLKIWKTKIWQEGYRNTVYKSGKTQGIE